MLREDGRLIATSYFDGTDDSAKTPKTDAAEHSREYVRRHWKYCESRPGFGPSTELLERAQSHFLCISGMAFQDAWNIDLERLQRCCVHVLTAEGGLIPFCAYYLTGSDGHRLIRATHHNRGTNSTGLSNADIR